MLGFFLESRVDNYGQVHEAEKRTSMSAKQRIVVPSKVQDNRPLKLIHIMTDEEPRKTSLSMTFIFYKLLY